MGKVVGRCGERGGEICRKVRRVFVGRCGERRGEIYRKVRRVVVGRREEDVEREMGKFVGRCGE